MPASLVVLRAGQERSHQSPYIHHPRCTHPRARYYRFPLEPTAPTASAAAAAAPVPQVATSSAAKAPKSRSSAKNDSDSAAKKTSAPRQKKKGATNDVRPVPGGGVPGVASKAGSSPGSSPGSRGRSLSAGLLELAAAAQQSEVAEHDPLAGSSSGERTMSVDSGGTRKRSKTLPGPELSSAVTASSSPSDDAFLLLQLHQQPDKARENPASSSSTASP